VNDVQLPEINGGQRAEIHSGNQVEENMSDQELMKYFEFDEGDLQANRNGEISEKQKSLVMKREKSRVFNNPFAKFGYLLAKVQGPIKIESLQTSYHGANLWYYLEVGEKSFRVDKDLSNIMAQGDVYSIYYCYEPKAPDDNGLYKILSAELISKAK
jgi:hypothetical protein